MFLKALALLLVLCAIFPISVLAYIDPGSGSLLLQVLIAGLLGLAFTLRLYWRRLKNFLGRFLSGSTRDDKRLPQSNGKDN